MIAARRSPGGIAGDFFRILAHSASPPAALPQEIPPDRVSLLANARGHRSSETIRVFAFIDSIYPANPTR